MSDFAPRRVASLQPSATDTLACLGLLDRVVACTRYCSEVCPEAATRRLLIADSWSALAKEILGARPDLVIASVPYRAEALSEILKAGIRFLGLSPRCLADIYRDIAAIAGIMGVAGRGLELIQQMQEEVEVVRARSASAPHQPRVFCEEWGKPIIASEPWVAELVEAAGGEFIGEAGHQISTEVVLAARPEVIVFAWTGAGDRVPATKLLRERQWLAAPAAHGGRIYVVRDALLNTPGPTLMKGLKALAWALHPEIFAAVEGIQQIADL